MLRIAVSQAAADAARSRTRSDRIGYIERERDGVHVCVREGGPVPLAGRLTHRVAERGGGGDQSLCQADKK